MTRCRNGAVVNYMEDYMRRRDPDSMRIADERPTDKPRFADVYGYPFRDLRTETMTWMEKQELILVPFWAGGRDYGYEALLLCPRNAAFFAFSLAQLQAFVDLKETEEGICWLAKHWKVPFLTFSAEELERAEGTFAESSFVRQTVGAGNVCERAALKSAGENGARGKRICGKQVISGVTIALAEETWKGTL